MDSLQTPLLLEEGDADGNVNPFPERGAVQLRPPARQERRVPRVRGRESQRRAAGEPGRLSTPAARVVRPLSEGRAGAVVDHRWRIVSDSSENSEGGCPRRRDAGPGWHSRPAVASVARQLRARRPQLVSPFTVGRRHSRWRMTPVARAEHFGVPFNEVDTNIKLKCRSGHIG